MSKKTWFLVVACVFVFSLSACKEESKTANSKEAGDEAGTAPAANEGTVLLEAAGRELEASLQKFYEKSAGAVGDALAIGWYNDPPIGKIGGDPTFPNLSYPDMSRFVAKCPTGSSTLACGGTIATLSNLNLSNFRMEISVESDPQQSWAILFRSSNDGLRSYSFEYDPWYHRYATWPNGETFPYGAWLFATHESLNLNTGAGKNVIGIRNFDVMPGATTHSFVIEAIGDKITVSEGDRMIISLQDDTYASGTIGFYTWLGSSFKVKSLKVIDKSAAAGLRTGLHSD